MIVEASTPIETGVAKKMRISLELVPRTETEFVQELNEVVERFSSIDLVNLPDIVRNDIRSWQACAIAKPYINTRIPHIRACDFSSETAPRLLDYLEQAFVNEVLIVAGDQIPGRNCEGMSTLQMIEYFKQWRPDLKVYAAIDPYRSSMKQEITYCSQKQQAGADGFFTQPLFDLRLLDMYAEQLEGSEVFWGLCPVVGDRSRNYWTKRNHVLFPKGFQAELQWNRHFTIEVLEYVQKHQAGHVYFMPIKVPVIDYLGGII